MKKPAVGFSKFEILFFYKLSVAVNKLASPLQSYTFVASHFFFTYNDDSHLHLSNKRGADCAETGDGSSDVDGARLVSVLCVVDHTTQQYGHPGIPTVPVDPGTTVLIVRCLHHHLRKNKGKKKLYRELIQNYTKKLYFPTPNLLTMSAYTEIICPCTTRQAQY
jgi:hypothetical protein